MKSPRLYRTTHLGTLLVLAILLVVLGPGVVRGKAESCATQERFITEPVDFDIESHIIRQMEAAGAFRTTLKFDFKEGELPAGFGKPTHHISDLRVQDGYLKFRARGKDSYFTLRGFQIPADEVSVIAIRAVFENAVGRLADKLRILFTSDSTHRRFSGRLVTPVKTDGKLRTVLLFTGGAPGWEGTITRLRVQPVKSEQDVAIHDIALLKITKDVDFSALDLPPAGAARTMTAQTLQNVVFARFPTPVEWTLTLPCEAELHAQLALPGIYRYLDWLPFHALVELQERTGEWTPISRLTIDRTMAQRLFQGVDLKLDLGRWSGQRVTLRLKTVEAEADSPSGGLVYWINPYVSSMRSHPKQPNIVLISIDTLRADHLSLYGYPRRTSPNIDAWAEEGFVFKHAFSQSSWTLPSHASLFTSLYPSQHQAILDDIVKSSERVRLSNAFVTMAERLQQGGYMTAGFVGGGLVSLEVNLDQGFDSWSQPFKFRRGLSKVEAWLDRHASTRFFLFLHTYEVHNYPGKQRHGIVSRQAAAFYPNYRGKVLDKDFNIKNHFENYHKTLGLDYEDLRFLEAMYDGEILALDKELSKFLEELSRRGLDENTVVIITSDHGEEFNEHGALHHGHSLYDEMIRVPLIIRYPQGPPEGRTVTQQVRLVDLYPTILELAGLTVPEGLEGRSLVPLMRGETEERERITFSENPRSMLSSIRTQSAKYIYRRGERLTFDLNKDPLEQYPDVRPPGLQKLLALHDRFTSKSGGYHLLARGPRLDGCPIHLTTDGNFLSALPRFAEPSDALKVDDDKQIEMTLTLKDGDVDGLYFLVHPASASVQVEICKRKGKARGEVKTRLGANGPVPMGPEWSVGQEISREAVRVSAPPLKRPDDLQADMALWNLETRPTADGGPAEASPEQRDEFLRHLRSLGYLE